MRTLTLPLKGIYFDAIKAGKKAREYRLATPYWVKRLQGQHYDQIVLTRGYPARGDTARRLVLPWGGYRMEMLQHEHFGPKAVHVFSIDVSRDPIATQPPGAATPKESAS